MGSFSQTLTTAEMIVNESQVLIGRTVTTQQQDW